MEGLHSLGNVRSEGGGFAVQGASTKNPCNSYNILDGSEKPSCSQSLGAVFITLLWSEQWPSVASELLRREGFELLGCQPICERTGVAL